MTQVNPREIVIARAGGCCEYCRSPFLFSSDDFAVEHILPKALVGSSQLENLAFSCQGCNNRKFTATSAIDPVSGEEVSLYNPRLDQWVNHFIWNHNAWLLIGLTPSARATIQKLDLNRSRVVNLRGILVLAGKHPPD